MIGLSGAPILSGVELSRPELNYMIRQPCQVPICQNASVNAVDALLPQPHCPPILPMFNNTASRKESCYRGPCNSLLNKQISSVKRLYSIFCEHRPEFFDHPDDARWGLYELNSLIDGRAHQYRKDKDEFPLYSNLVLEELVLGS